MKAFIPVFCCIFLLLFVSASVLAQHSGNFDTWWEQSGFTETPRYDETIEYAKRLAKASPLISFQVFGKSPQGRDLPLLILDQDGFSTPEEVNRSGKLKVLIQACIHAGESEGKDAGLALFRDIAINHKDIDLDHITVLLIPIFNVDGHERFTPYSRINQNGPKEAGWRTTATNLNLNRDYLKADTPEMQAWLKLFNRWSPDLFIDCHTSDGADYQYPVTLEYDGFQHQLLDQWLSGSFIPALTNAMEMSGYPLFNYVAFRKWHDPRSGLVDHIPGPRFSTGYVSARNRVALLIETHMLKDYKTRVLGTYYLLENTLKLVTTETREIKAFLHAADSLTASMELRSEPCILEYTPSITDSVMVEFRGVDYTVEKSDLTGGNWYHYGHTPTSYSLPLFNSQVPTRQVRLPEAYVIPVEWQDVIRRLDWHGIRYEVLQEPTVFRVETYRFSEPHWTAEPYEGRQILASLRMDTVRIERLYAPGSVKVSTSQPNARLIAFMFEPMTEESFLRWGFFNSIFEEKEYVETYVMEKMAREMIGKDPGLKVRFDKLKSEDPAFAADSYAQLMWFYRQTPYYDPTIGLYPVGRL
jgi:hypothetical protein